MTTSLSTHRIVQQRSQFRIGRQRHSRLSFHRHRRAQPLVQHPGRDVDASRLGLVLGPDPQTVWRSRRRLERHRSSMQRVPAIHHARNSGAVLILLRITVCSPIITRCVRGSCPRNCPRSRTHPGSCRCSTPQASHSLVPPTRPRPRERHLVCRGHACSPACSPSTSPSVDAAAASFASSRQSPTPMRSPECSTVLPRRRRQSRTVNNFDSHDPYGPPGARATDLWAVRTPPVCTGRPGTARAYPSVNRRFDARLPSSPLLARAATPQPPFIVDVRSMFP